MKRVLRSLMLLKKLKSHDVSLKPVFTVKSFKYVYKSRTKSLISFEGYETSLEKFDSVNKESQKVMMQG